MPVRYGETGLLPVGRMARFGLTHRSVDRPSGALTAITLPVSQPNETVEKVGVDFKRDIIMQRRLSRRKIVPIIRKSWF